MENKDLSLERITACIKSCEGIKTEALKRGFVKDLISEYYETCDLHELEALLTNTEGALYESILKEVTGLWSDINLQESLKEIAKGTKNEKLDS